MSEINIHPLHLRCLETSTGCWEFQGSRNTSGYGQVWLDSRIVLVHRYSWMRHYGVIPTGVLVLHTCDNRICCNPEHLFLGTHQDNSDDKIAKGRMNDRTGSKNSYAVLDESKVKEIKRLITENMGTSAIGRIFNVSPCTISDIKFGRSWTHV